MPCKYNTFDGRLRWFDGVEGVEGKRGRVLNWANVCSPEHTSDSSTNYDSFLN